MVLKADQERLKALLSETVLLLCKNGLEFKSDFCIEALIGITVDQDDVFLISIKETVENELRAAQRAKEEAEKLALEAAQSPAPESPSRTHRKRKRKSPRPQSPSQDKNIKLETSGDRELDNNTSNTSFQDYNDESQHSRNMKFESGGAGDMGGDDEDNSNEIVFVKTENTDDQSLYGGPGQSSFLDSPYQSGMDSSQMSSSFQSPGAHSSHPGTSSWQSPMDSSQQGMSQNPLETQQTTDLTDETIADVGLDQTGTLASGVLPDGINVSDINPSDVNIALGGNQGEGYLAAGGNQPVANGGKTSKQGSSENENRKDTGNSSVETPSTSKPAKPKKAVKCPWCPKVFTSKFATLRHIKTHHVVGAERFLCNLCGASLKRKDYLDDHLKSCSKKTPKLATQ